MKLWNALTAYNPDSRAPVSFKALLYACLVSFFGWAFIYCGLGYAMTDPQHEPYGHPAFLVGICLLLVLWCLVTILWFGAFRNAPHMIRNFLILVTASTLGFFPSVWLMNRIADLARILLHAILGG